MKKRIFAGLLALCMIFNVMPATAFAEEATTEPVVTEVVCEAKEDCTAETHIETCAKYVAPVVVCEAAEDCAAETHIETCAKYVTPCTNDEECLAEEHAEGCPADVVYLPCSTEGCELVEGHPGECTGQTIFVETAEDKLRAAISNGGTVVLDEDVILTDTLMIPAGVEVTLDLNGKKISQEKECTASYSMIENKGNLTITGNGTISFNDIGKGDPNFGWGSYTIRNEGTLIVENGTIEHLGKQNPGGGAPNVHMYCAIFQYSGSTTIKGGKISTPTYRSARLWKGDMTVKGGTFEGQLWVQSVDDSAVLAIEGGSFEPRGNDGSSVYVENSSYTVAFNVSGGKFETKIGCANASALAGAITGGTYTEAAVNGTNPDLLGEGLEFVQDDAGNYVVAEKPRVAVNDTTGEGYATLEEAISAAKAGDTVVLMKNIELNNTVVISADDKITLDLNGKTITGTDSTNANFGLVTVNKGDLTVKDSIGSGKITLKATVNSGWNRYSAVIANNQGTVTVKSGTIEHFGGTDMAYAIDNLTNSGIGAATLTIEGGTIVSPYRAIRQFANCTTHVNKLEVKGGTITGTNKGIWLQSSNAKANKAELIISDGSVSSVYIWTPEGGDVTGLYLMAKLGTVTDDMFVNGLGNPNYVIDFVDGSYQITTRKFAEVNGVGYETLQLAIDAAKAGDTVKLLEDIELDGMATVSADDNIILDLNGKTIVGVDTTSKNFGLITVNKGNLTVNDSVGGGKITLEATIDSDWNRYSAVIANNQGTVTVKSGTIEHLGGTDMAYAIDNLTNSGIGPATLTVEGGKLVSPYRAIRQFANCTKELNKLEVKGGTIIGANKGIWLQSSNTSANKAELVISDGTVSSVFVSAPVNADTTALSVTISGGYFSAGKEAVVIKDVITNIKGFISGGYFVEKPASEQIANGLVANLETNVKDGVTYLYVIGEKIQGEPELAVTPTEPKVKSKVETDHIEDNDLKNKIEDTVTQITNPDTSSGKGTTSFESTLPEASNVATEMNTNDHTEAFDSLNEVLTQNNNQAVGSAEDITIHVRPYLDIQVEDVDIPEAGSTDAPEVTLNIEMKYDVVASTEKDAEDIRTADDVEVGDEDQINSVVTESGKTLDVEQGTEVEITVPLPEIFDPVNDVIVVKHIKDDGTVYYYDAIVNDDGTITFINPNGFSTFIITRDNRTATVKFEISDTAEEVISYGPSAILSADLPTAEKDGYIHTGWEFENIPGTYSGKMTDNLLTLLSALYGQSGTPIVATPVFEEAPTPSGGSSSNDSIAEEEKTEKPVQTDSVGKETVEEGKDELGTLIGDSYGLYKLALSVELKGKIDKATDIKIKVDGVTKADSVIILQKTADGWKAVPAEAGDGYVIGKFTSLSEVLIFVNENGEVEAAQEPELVEVAMVSKPASTGDSANILAYAGMISVAAAGLAVLFFRKRRA